MFALGAALHELRPGAYVVKVKDDSPSAGQRGDDATTSPRASAYRWIIYTDMALQSFSGATGLDVVVRSLRTARPMSDVTLTLIAAKQRRTGARAHRWRRPRALPDALVNGDGPARARYVMAYGAARRLRRAGSATPGARSVRSRRRWAAYARRCRRLSLHRARHLSPRRARAPDRLDPRSGRPRDRQPAIDARDLSPERHRSAPHPHRPKRSMAAPSPRTSSSIAPRRAACGARS